MLDAKTKDIKTHWRKKMKKKLRRDNKCESKGYSVTCDGVII